MTLRQFAFKYIRGKWHQYTAYFVSSAFTVMIFFMYAAFIFHPDVIDGDVHRGVRSLMIACEWIIVVFALFFIHYSHSAFLKSRTQEFGLFMLMGMTRAQLIRTLFFENTIISILSILSGTVLGVLFSRLFFVLISALLDLEDPIPFHVAPAALGVTCLSFFLIGVLMSALSLWRVGRSQIIDLMKEKRQPKSLPVFSKWLVVVSVFCLVSGYALAWFSGTAILITMFPILFLVIAGTYLLFTQSSVAFLRSIRRNRRILYKHTHLITVSQLVYKLKDNARVMFVVAVLSSVVLTASGTLYTFYDGMTSQIVKMTPHAISLTAQGGERDDRVHPDTVESILAEHGLTVSHQYRVVGIAGEITQKGDRVPVGDAPLIISNKTYNDLAQQVQVESLKVERESTVIVNPFARMGDATVDLSDIRVKAGDEEVTLSPRALRTEAVLNQGAHTDALLVVNDALFEQLAEHTSAEDLIVSYGYELENWAHSLKAVEEVEALLPEERQQHLTSRVQPFVEVKQIFGLTMFIGLFVSVLFFIAAGSMLYFKLFTEFQEDREQFTALKRIGITDGEIKKIVTTHIGTIFFLPFGVGVVHAAFALKTLGDVLMVPVWQYASIVTGIYFVLQLAYFLLSRYAYVKRMAHPTSLP